MNVWGWGGGGEYEKFPENNPRVINDERTLDIPFVSTGKIKLLGSGERYIIIYNIAACSAKC